MQHLLAGPNVALCTVKAVETGHGFSHVFVTKSLADHHCVSLKEVNYILPLFLHPQKGNPSTGELGFGPAIGGRRSNLSQEFYHALERKIRVRVDDDGYGTHTVAAEEAFGFVYGILFAPSYRQRYASFLRKEFARIRVPRSLELFREMARLGSELVALHLMESPKLANFITTYAGPKKPEVGRVGWSDDTVWLDAAATKKGQPATPGTIGFDGVAEAVWNFHIGGYQVCEKWLKDRKGRRLSEDDLAHYQKIVVALAETIRLMREIDEVIEQHGGWPGAFAQGGGRAPEAPSADKVVPLPPSKPTDSAHEVDPSPLLKPAEPEAPPCRADDGRASGTIRLDRNGLDREELICRIRRMFGDGEERVREAAIEALARELGFRRSGNGIEEELDNALRTAVRRGILTNERGALSGSSGKSRGITGPAA